MPWSTESSRKNSACMRLPISRPCMSVNATTTVSIAPDPTSARSSSSLSTPETLIGSLRVDAREIAERLWPGGVRSLEPLGGGITNRNFRVDVDGEGSLVLRIGGKDTALLGIDRHVEHAASRAASALGLGPDVVAFVEPEGYLVTRYVDGVAPSAAEIRETRLPEIASALRRFHEGPPI